MQRQWFPPQTFGLENLDPHRPALYVGNHTIYGILDGPLMVLEVYEKTGIYFRSLGDHFHFVVPGWREMLLEGILSIAEGENPRAIEMKLQGFVE